MRYISVSLLLEKTLFLDLVILYQTKRSSVSGSKIYVEIQAFDFLSESLSSGVRRFVT